MIYASYGIAQRGRYVNGKGGITKQHLEFQKEKGICNAITTVSKDFMVIIRQDKANMQKGVDKVCEK